MHFPHNDSLIVTMHIDSCRICRILVDSGSSVNILYESALDRMEYTLKLAWAMICLQTQSNLYRFDGNETRSLAQSRFWPAPIRTTSLRYVIDVASPHNAILGRPWIHAMKVVPSSYHQLL